MVWYLFHLQSAQKWKQLSELAIAKSQFGLAMDCLYSAKDYSGLMLLASSAGDATTVEKITTVASSEGQNNLAFMSNFLLGRYVDGEEAKVPPCLPTPLL